MIAVRSNERAASASGIGVFHTKLMAFAISGALAGLAGILISFQYQAMSFVVFDPFTSLLVLAWIVIGGVGFLFGTLNPGALLAPGALLSLIGLYWPGSLSWLPIVGGVGALIAVRFNQDGITSNNITSLHALGAKLQRYRPTPRRTAQADVSSGVVAPSRVKPKSLRIEDLKVRYGGVVAVDSIGIDVNPGDVVGLIGPNCARWKDLSHGRCLRLHPLSRQGAARRTSHRQLAVSSPCLRRAGSVISGTRAISRDDRAGEPPGAA